MVSVTAVPAVAACEPNTTFLQLSVLVELCLTLVSIALKALCPPPPNNIYSSELYCFAKPPREVTRPLVLIHI